MISVFHLFLSWQTYLEVGKKSDNCILLPSINNSSISGDFFTVIIRISRSRIRSPFHDYHFYRSVLYLAISYNFQFFLPVNQFKTPRPRVSASLTDHFIRDWSHFTCWSSNYVSSGKSEGYYSRSSGNSLFPPRDSAFRNALLQSQKYPSFFHCLALPLTFHWKIDC